MIICLNTYKSMVAYPFVNGWTYTYARTHIYGCMYQKARVHGSYKTARLLKTFTFCTNLHGYMFEHIQFYGCIRIRVCMNIHICTYTNHIPMHIHTSIDVYIKKYESMDLVKQCKTARM